MLTPQRIIMAMLVIAVVLEAGIILGAILGDSPAIQQLSLQNYAAYWQAVDRKMAARMPFLSITILLLYAALLLQHKRRIGSTFWLLLTCMALNVSATAYTLVVQLPVNQAVQRLNLTHLDLVQAEHLRNATVQHFHVRVWPTLGAFVLLVFTLLCSADSAAVISGQQALEH